MDRKTFLLDLMIGIPTLIEAKSAQDRLQNRAGQSQKILINAGIGGNNSKDLLARLNRDCLSYKPDLVILMVGTNDMNYPKYVPIDEFKANILDITHQIKKTHSKVLLLTILPFYEPYLLQRHPKAFYKPEGPHGRWVAMNQVIRSVAIQTRSHFLDLGTIVEKIGKIGEGQDSLLQNELNSGNKDGVHPTPNGYRFIALALSLYIQSNNLPTNRIVCLGDSITKGDGSVDKDSYPGYLSKLL